MNQNESIIIIIPLYRDWECFQLLVPALEQALSERWSKVKIIVVDDFSLRPLPTGLANYSNKIEIIELVRNLGHQKAVTIGLSYAVEKFSSASSFVIMDADGEDRPEDILTLLEIVETSSQTCAFAKRQKRSEGIKFRTFYYLYKGFFKILTGQEISFGNFCILPVDSAKRLVHVPEIWLHFPSAVIKSRVFIQTFPSSRGKRYFGSSKMNFTSLVSHGLSAIAVYSEFVAVRITLISIGASFIALLGILILFYIKNFTSLAIPGWTSFLTLAFLILIAQFFTLGILLAFIILSTKTLKNINPSKIFKNYIFKIHYVS